MTTPPPSPGRQVVALVVLGAALLTASYPPFRFPILSFVAVTPAVVLLRALERTRDYRAAFRQVVDMGAIFEHLSASLKRELDFRQEASNIERMRSVLTSYPRLAVPQVYGEVHGFYDIPDLTDWSQPQLEPSSGLFASSSRTTTPSIR